LSIEHCVPAPGQGIVVVEAREGDTRVWPCVERVRNEAGDAMLAAERALVEALGGDCQIPLGAIARLDAAGIDMTAIVSSLDGLRVIRRQARGPVAYPERLGKRLADELANAGANDILNEARDPAAGRNGAY
jgi:hydroxymethylbilane synthase